MGLKTFNNFNDNKKVNNQMKTTMKKLLMIRLIIVMIYRRIGGMNQNLKKLLIKDDNKSSGFNIDYEHVPKKKEIIVILKII